MPKHGRFEEYLEDLHEQEWEDTVIYASDLANTSWSGPPRYNKEEYDARRLQAIQKNKNKAKTKSRKKQRSQKLKMKKKAKAAAAEPDARAEKKEKRWIVIETKKESKRHSRGRNHRKPSSRK